MPSLNGNHGISNYHTACPAIHIANKGYICQGTYVSCPHGRILLAIGPWRWCVLRPAWWRHHPCHNYSYGLDWHTSSFFRTHNPCNWRHRRRRNNVVRCPNWKYTHFAMTLWSGIAFCHYDVKWKHFPRYWPFVRESAGGRWIPL